MPHIQRRLEIFESIKARQLERLNALTGDISISVITSTPSLIKNKKGHLANNNKFPYNK